MNFFSDVYMEVTSNNKFWEAYCYVRGLGLLRTQKDLATMMHASTATICKALKGDTTALTPKFLRKFNHTFDDMFEEKWLLAGVGDMLKATRTNNINVEQNNVSINGDNSNNIGLMTDVSANGVNAQKIIDHHQREIAALHQEIEGYQKICAKAQEQVDKLFALIEKMGLGQQ